VIAVSEFTKRELVSLLQVPEDKIRVVPNGVEDVFAPDGPRAEGDYVLAVGTLEPRKNLARIAQAVEGELRVVGVRGWGGVDPPPNVTWLGGIDASSTTQGFIPLPFSLPVLGDGISIFAIVYTVLQLVASRMALPPHDPNTPLDQNARTQRSVSLFLPFITLLYGHVIPVGLFIYLIVSTAYQAVQQFLTTGWGSLFPIVGWTPGFAVDHTPRFPVAVIAAPKSVLARGGSTRAIQT